MGWLGADMEFDAKCTGWQKQLTITHGDASKLRLIVDTSRRRDRQYADQHASKSRPKRNCR